jgi:AcrR family transcriptional regulator
MLQPVSFTHEVFFYSSDQEFADGLAPQLSDAVERAEGAIAVTTESRIEVLREGLGRAADQVAFFDATRWYRRPGAALVAWRDALDQELRSGRPHVRAIGEIEYGSDELAIRSWGRYESLVNRAFASHPLWITCAYNTGTVPEAILDEARRTHPVISTGSGRGPSATHFGAHELGAPLEPAEDRADAEERTRVTVGGTGDVVDVRRRVRWDGQSAGLSVDTVDDLLLAVTELVGRSIAHPGATATVRTARQASDWYCEIRFEHLGSERLALAADDVDVLIGRVISDRVELAEDSESSLIRFVFRTEPGDSRQRIIDAAAELFRGNGVRATGINAVIAQAGVAKATFYAHFRSKDELIRLWLRGPSARWFDQVLAEVEARAANPAERLTTFFDVLGEWLTEDGFRGCPFINTATEFRNADHLFSRELEDVSREIEEYLRRTATEAGFADPEHVAEQLFLLVPGTITTASARVSADPVRAARAAALTLLASAVRL